MSVRFGFLGAGWIARQALAPAVHAADGAVLQAVAARGLDRAAGLVPAGRCYDDYEALLADPDVDVVYISLSNEAHVPWVVRALEAGHHVLCEKPLGLDAAEVDRAFRAAAAADRLLVEAFWYRWHPRSLRTEALIAEGALGRVRRVQAALSFDGDWSGTQAGNYRLDAARGGGAWYDVGVYPLSLAAWALADEGFTADAVSIDHVAAVWSTAAGDAMPAAGGGAPVDGAVDLRLATRLRSATGAQAELRCGIAGPAEQVATITGDVSLSWDAGAFMTWNQPCSLRISGGGRGEPVVEEFGAVDPYRSMVEAVAARVRGEEAFVVEPAASLTIAAVADRVRVAAVGSPPGEEGSLL